MSKAYKCDRCQERFDGDSEIMIKTNKMIVAINYLPEVKENANWYLHDFCPVCTNAICDCIKNKETHGKD